MTKQEIFDTVAVHMLAQGKKSENEDGCLYRGPNGTKCAVGVLIKDEIYRPILENRLVCERIIWEALEDSGIEMDGDIEQLLMALQETHDHISVQTWKHQFGHIAKRHGLNTDAIAQFARFPTTEKST